MFKNENRKLGVSRVCYASIFQPSMFVDCNKVRKHFVYILYAWNGSFPGV